MRYKATIFVCCLIFLSEISFSQSAQVTVNSLRRTFLIQTSKGRGTAFSIDVDNREYWITAKHIFTGIESGPPGSFTTKVVRADILSQNGSGDAGQDQHWIPVTFSTLDPGEDIDILVLAPDHRLLNFPPDFNLPADDSRSVTVGGECEFLGYPYGGGWKSKWSATNEWMWWPFVKHCTLSGSITQGNILIFVLDGINNKGFSGGPVLFGTGSSQKVFAVISGFYTEPLEVLPAPGPGLPRRSSLPPPPDLPGQVTSASRPEIVEANSGFILAYDIAPAIKAIRANPVGPMVVAPADATKGK